MLIPSYSQIITTFVFAINLSLIMTVGTAWLIFAAFVVITTQFVAYEQRLVKFSTNVLKTVVSELLLDQRVSGAILPILTFFGANKQTAPKIVKTSRSFCTLTWTDQHGKVHGIFHPYSRSAPSSQISCCSGATEIRFAYLDTLTISGVTAKSLGYDCVRVEDLTGEEKMFTGDEVITM